MESRWFFFAILNDNRVLSKTVSSIECIRSLDSLSIIRITLDNKAVIASISIRTYCKLCFQFCLKLENDERLWVRLRFCIMLSVIGNVIENLVQCKLLKASESFSLCTSFTIEKLHQFPKMNINYHYFMRSETYDTSLVQKWTLQQ